jgi:hypothetical protein
MKHPRTYSRRIHLFLPIWFFNWLLIALLSNSVGWSQAPKAAGLATEESSRASKVFLPFAHAHNDYLHQRPLLDAMEQGFASVEADIFLIEGELFVAHTFAEVDKSKTLRNSYLDPLRQIVERNKGRVYPGVKHPLVLLVDIKTEAKKTFAELHRQLTAYRSILVEVQEGGKPSEGAVQVIVSGNRPFRDIEEASPRLVAIDGRLSDLGLDRSKSLYPLISDHWNSHFRWRGVGEISDEELKKLRTIVQSTHEEGRRLRFWAIPDRVEVWKLLHREKVDLINTDRLLDLRTAFE